MEHIKINDLSVGDWVMYEGNHRKVALIDGVNGLIKFALSPNFVGTGAIEPIPITPDILKSNGWYEDDYDTGTDYITDNTNIMYNKERKDWKACIMNGSPVVRVKVFFFYVHELQHALRLAKIAEEIEL